MSDDDICPVCNNLISLHSKDQAIQCAIMIIKDGKI